MGYKSGVVYRFHTSVYPLYLWVVVYPNEAELCRHFEIIEFDEYGVVQSSPLSIGTIKANWGACHLFVRHKGSGSMGSLICIMSLCDDGLDKTIYGRICHECSHAYDDYVKVLDLPPTGECRAYLSEWLYEHVYDVVKDCF